MTTAMPSTTKEYLRHFHVVHKNSLHEDSPAIETIDGRIKIPLHRHQKAVLARMESLEQSLSNGYQIENNEVYANYGILGDAVGAGKSLMILAHIARLGRIDKTNSITAFSQESFFSIKTKIHTDASEVGSLILVPHTLFRQWADYIKKQTTLKAFCPSRVSDVYADDFFTNVHAAEVVLVSNTLIKSFLPRCEEQDLKWKRVFVDEADTIHLVGLNARRLPRAQFYWYVTASWINLIHPNNCIYMDKNTIQNQILNNSEYAHAHPHFQSLLNGSNTYYAYATHHVKSYTLLRESLSAHHPLRSHVIVRCSDAFIQSSVSLPPLIRQVIWCKAPLTNRIVQGAVGSEIQQMLHAGDVTAALEHLGVKGQDSKTLVEAVTATLRKELSRLEKTYAFKESMEYSTPAAKETALKHLEEKIEKTKGSIRGIEERIQSLGTEMCPICYDDPSEALVTPCCSRAFCAACLLLSMARNAGCPMCRSGIHPSSCTRLILRSEEGNQIVDAATAEPQEPELLKKQEALLKLMKETPNGRFLVFSRYDNPFDTLETALEGLDIKVKQLKGNKDAIAATLRAFDSGALRCLLLNSRFAGSGLNIIGATHVVLYHAMTHEEEKQILGRAYRMGRKGPLTFIKLLNKDEDTYSEVADGAVAV